MFEVTPLRYFVSSFELGTISAAAAAHGISQPSLSQALQKLEDTIGSPLFLRSRKGLRPTATGRELYGHAQSILGAVQRAESRFRQAGPLRLSIYTAPDILLAPFQGAFQALHRCCPTLEMRFEASAADAELALVDRSCAPRGHRFHELTREPYVFAVSNAHPLAGKKQVSLDDIRAEPLIARRYCPFYEAFLAEISLKGICLAVSAEAVHDQQVLELVSLGLGAAFLPASHAALRETISGIPVQHEQLTERRIGIAVKKTAFADDMYRKWISGWTATPVQL